MSLSPFPQHSRQHHTSGRFKPAIVFYMGDKFDKSFNQGVYNRVEKFAKESGVKYRKFDITNET